MNQRKAFFFDEIAPKWDGFEDLLRLRQRLEELLVDFGVKPNERVVDVGCGTGNLTLALLSVLGPSGRVEAVDISAGMLRVARAKVRDPRVRWHHVDGGNLPLATGETDRILCCAVWPHFDDPASIGREFHRVLKPDGSLHVWHLSSREKINRVHAHAGDPIRQDLLAPARDTADLLADCGFGIVACEEGQDLYMVSGIRRDSGSAGIGSQEAE